MTASDPIQPFTILSDASKIDEEMMQSHKVRRVNRIAILTFLIGYPAAGFVFGNVFFLILNFAEIDATQPAGLVAVLLDGEAPFGDRHDAAMDLAGYDEPEVWEALTRVKNDPNEEPDIIEEAEQSLLEIQRRRAES